MITCKLCNKRMKQVTCGHLAKHGVSLEQYKQMFPGVETLSLSTKSARSAAIKNQIKNGTHFVPFRDLEGFAQKVHDRFKQGPIDYTCIRCGKVKQTNGYWAKRRKFCSNECHASHIRENPSLYKDRNKKISSSNKGKARKGRYSTCKGGFRPDLGHYVRSGWEADVCRLFMFHNRPYEYESYTIELEDGSDTLFWTVDLLDPTNFMSNGLIEIKGWWDEKSKRKLQLLQLQQPKVRDQLSIIGVSEMKDLIREYSSVIPNWESKR